MPTQQIVFQPNHKEHMQEYGKAFDAGHTDAKRSQGEVTNFSNGTYWGFNGWVHGYMAGLELTKGLKGAQDWASEFMKKVRESRKAIDEGRSPVIQLPKKDDDYIEDMTVVH